MALNFNPPLEDPTGDPQIEIAWFFCYYSDIDKARKKEHTYAEPKL
jgi:hypothetical protein